MSAVVRVKRRIDEEPLSAFVLNGKRRRLEENSDTTLPTTSKDELSTVVKFACTIKEQDDKATALYARLTNEEAKEMILKKSQKTADDEKDIIHIINEVSTSAADAAALADILTTPTSYGYEISTSITSNAQHADYGDLMDGNHLSVLPFNDLIDEDYEYASDDSNDENYYKNDYPEEEDRLYDDEEDEDARNLCMFDNHDEDDKYVDEKVDDIESYDDKGNDKSYSDSSAEQYTSYKCINRSDVEHYGGAYAHYKARILKQFKASDDDEDDLEVVSYKSATNEDDDEYYDNE